MCGLAGRYITYPDVDWGSVGRPMLVCSASAPGRSQGFFCNQRLHCIVLARQLGIHPSIFRHLGFHATLPGLPVVMGCIQMPCLRQMSAAFMPVYAS